MDIVQSYVVHAPGVVRERVDDPIRLPGEMQIVAGDPQCH